MPDIHRGKTVKSLRRTERGHYPPRVDAARQWQLDKDAVDSVVAIEPGDQLEDFRHSAIAGQAVFERSDPHFGTGACLVANIDLARRIVADQDRGKTGGDPEAVAEDRGCLRRALPATRGDPRSPQYCRPGPPRRTPRHVRDTFAALAE